MKRLPETETRETDREKKNGISAEKGEFNYLSGARVLELNLLLSVKRNTALERGNNSYMIVTAHHVCRIWQPWLWILACHACYGYMYAHTG